MVPVGELNRPVVGTAQEAHDAVDPAELLEIQPRQTDEAIADQEREPFL